jgi:hypothetical protein
MGKDNQSAFCFSMCFYVLRCVSMFFDVFLCFFMCFSMLDERVGFPIFLPILIQFNRYFVDRSGRNRVFCDLDCAQV